MGRGQEAENSRDSAHAESLSVTVAATGETVSVDGVAHLTRPTGKLS